jgi:hypothetical protein
MPNSWYLQPLKGISGDFCGRQRLKPRKSVAIAQIWDYVRKILHETSGNYFIVHQIRGFLDVAPATKPKYFLNLYFD